MQFLHGEDKEKKTGRHKVSSEPRAYHLKMEFKSLVERSRLTDMESMTCLEFLVYMAMSLTDRAAQHG